MVLNKPKTCSVGHKVVSDELPDSVVGHEALMDGLPDSVDAQEDIVDNRKNFPSLIKEGWTAKPDGVVNFTPLFRKWQTPQKLF